MNNLRRESDEVFYATDGLAIVDEAAVAFLKTAAAATPRLRSRLCLHEAPSSLLHEMVIVHHRSAYVRPHRHTGKDESFLVIEGEADVLFFDDEGRIETVRRFSHAGGNRPFYYHLPEAIWHGLIVHSEWLVFHEATLGPFDPTQSQFPSWAPDGKDEAEAQRYLEELRTRAITLIQGKEL